MTRPRKHIRNSREVYKVSITAGELKIVYYGYVTGDAIHSATSAYHSLTRTEKRAPYAYIPYEGKSRRALRHLFDGAYQVQQRPKTKCPPFPIHWTKK